jgi:hypothetical protein
MKKQIGPRVGEAAHDWYAAHFGNPNAGASYILEAFPALYRATMIRELRGKFTRPELMLILEVCNGLLLTPGIAGQHLVLSVHDGIELNGLDEKWQVDREQITAKLSTMTVAHLVVMEIWARAYWESAWRDEATGDKWISEIAA